jgi:hypothetical protein
MTNAPDDLLVVRRYLLAAAGLADDAVGIVGDPAHASTGGYHEGNNDLGRVGRLTSDYSKRESARDRPGTDSASAEDIGQWGGVIGRRRLSWLAFNAELVAACQRGDSRTRDIREVIYTPDGVTVRRWDALGVRSTGDSSHLYHTHLSFFRDSEGRRAAPDNILGLLADLIDGEVPNVALDGIDRAQVSNSEHYLQALISLADQATGLSNTSVTTLTAPNLLAAALKRVDAGVAQLLTAAAAEAARDAGLRSVIDALAAAVNAAGGSVDTAAILAGVADAVHTAVAPLEDTIAELRHRLAAAERAAGDAAAAVIEPAAG